MTLTSRNSRVSRAALAIGLCLTAWPALAQDTAAGDPATETAAGEPVPAPAGPRTYTPEDLARFAPRTALDMVQRVPGFSIRDAPQERGLGQASANVLLNGRRIGGKSDAVASQLGRIPAQNVVRIEIRDGATLDVPGLSGEVANVITRSSRMTGQYSWRPEFRARHTSPLFTRFDVSVSGTEGPVEYTLGLENQSNHSGAGGDTRIHDADRSFLERRTDLWTNNAEAPRISGRFEVDGPGSSVGNLNFSYRRYWIDYDETGLRTSPGQPDRVRTVVQDVHGYDYEIGGDFEFALGPGRLKLIGLNRFDHEPLVQTVIVDPAGAAPPTGDRFARVADTIERIARAEYRWRGGGADWQISGEAAFNSLDSVSELFVLSPSGEFDEIPLPFGSGRVEEDRYELMGSYGRPLGSELTMQLSAGAEYSQLRQVGAAGLVRSFWRPKGQAAFAWRPDERWNVNLRLQRRVGQLNFLDFLQSVNLNEERENAGNPDLVPPQSWEADLEAIRNLGRYGTTTLRLYGRWYDDIVDIVPIGTDGESPGNIDRAVVYGVEWKTTFNFDPMGWVGARLDGRVQLQHSRVDDPLTGEPRQISNSLVRLFAVSLRHDIPGSDWAWGGAVDHAFSALNYRLTEVGRQWEGPVWANLYVEHKDVMGLTVRATVGNILGARSTWARTGYEGRRTGPVAYFEDRNRTIGPIFSFSVRGRF